MANRSGLNNYTAAVLNLPYRFVHKIFWLLSQVTQIKNIAAIVDQAIVSGANFLTGVIVGRYLVKEEFGLYMLGFGIVLFILNIQTSVITTPYAALSHRSQAIEKRFYTGSTLIHHFVLSAFGALSLFLVSIVLSFGIGPSGLTEVAEALAFIAFFILLRDYCRRVYFAWLNIVSALVLDTCVSLLQICGLLLLAYAGKLSVTNAFVVSGSACGFAGIIWLIRHKSAFSFSFSKIVNDMKRNWVLAKWIFATAVSTTLSAELYPWFLTGFYNTAVTGELAACKWIIFLANPFMIGLSNLLIPKSAHAFAHNGWHGLRSVVISFSIITIFLMGTFCIIMFFAGGWLVEQIYGAKYSGYGLIVSLLAIAQLITAMLIPISSSFVALKRTDILFKSSLLSNAIALLIGIPAVWLFGLLGAAVVMILTAFGGSLFRLWNFVALANNIPPDALSKRTQ